MRIGQFFCGLFTSHKNAVTTFDAKNRKIVLTCTNCGHNSPGLQLNDKEPLRRLAGDNRHVMTNPRV